MPRSNTKPCSRRPPAPSSGVRPTEREADRLSVWILANAGYHPQAAERMIGLIDPHCLFAIASPTHGTNRTRAPEMTTENAVLRAASDAD